MPTSPERGPRRPRVTRPRDRRPNSSQRGYGYRWQRYARGFLSQFPLCVHCERAGRTTAAAAVDHIQRVTGPTDPLFWRRENHQPLCWSCHSRKTATETR